MQSAPFQAIVYLDVPWIIQFKNKIQTSALLLVFLWLFLFLLLHWLPLPGTLISQLSSLCQNVMGTASVSAGEDLGSWALEVSRESLADEPKYVFDASVILLRNQVKCVG